MNSEKFYNFVRAIASNDPTLVESIIEAHKVIYESESLNEGKIGKTLATAGLALGLMGGGSQAHAGFFGGDKAKTEMAGVQTPEQVKATTQKLLQQIGDDFIETNSFTESEYVKQLAQFIQSLPEDLKTVALSECGRFKNQFRLGTPSDNIVSALGQYNVAMR